MKKQETRIMVFNKYTIKDMYGRDKSEVEMLKGVRHVAEDWINDRHKEGFLLHSLQVVLIPDNPPDAKSRNAMSGENVWVVMVRDAGE